MAGARGKVRVGETEAAAPGEEGAASGGAAMDAEVSEFEEARARLRRRWELASVLNFMHVFKPALQSNLEVSGEAIEEALINADDVLAKIHIMLLKGIPPVSKNLKVPDAWVTVLCKRLDEWWPWVGEGDIPLEADRGAEIPKYKGLDSITRLLILKALCEIRAEQDDIQGYIEETLKNGTPLSTFRKERFGVGKNGTTYWYDGDSVIGHRLYKETVLVDSKPKSKGKGRSAKETIDFLWETLATDLEQFKEISAKLSSSAIADEAAAGNTLNDEIIPIIEKLQKKKERARHRKQRETMLLASYSVAAIGSRRSCRDRNTVRYTFEDYDRSINEAIQMEREWKAPEKSKGSAPGQEDNDAEANAQNAAGIAHESVDGADDDYQHFSSDDGDDNYTENDTDSSDDAIDSDDSDKENDNAAAHDDRRRRMKSVDVTGLRRSTRNMHIVSNGDGQYSSEEDSGPVQTKKVLRERPTRNTGCKPYVASDSEDSTASEDDQSI